MTMNVNTRMQYPRPVGGAVPAATLDSEGLLVTSNTNRSKDVRISLAEEASMIAARADS